MIDEDEDSDDDDMMSTSKRVALAKLIAASLIEQEAALLNAASFDFENQADQLLGARVIERVKTHLRQVAGKLREPH
jgi:hypothetical protein